MPSYSQVSRRRFLRAAAGGAVSGFPACLRRPPRPIEGGFADRSSAVGHRIRDGAAEQSIEERVKIPLAIVGGGIAGLSAAWRLDKLGFRDFVVLELEEQAGGNSRSGEDAGMSYPWGAHYVPLPDRRIPLVHELFEELGVLQDGRWNPEHICREPLNRLFIDGEWTEGLEPGPDAATAERDQFDRFWDRMDFYRQGGEFTIPIRRPEQTADLDHQSMKTWMVEEGFFSERLHWYVDYGCRDDYGASYSAVSAWAGIHYFAARPENDIGVLTWPEGNGWIVGRLLERIGRFVRTGSAVRRIRELPGGVEITCGSTVYEAEAVVFAAPLFLVPYLMPEVATDLPSLSGFTYSPWMVANLTVEDPPAGEGFPTAWENIIHDSPALGYLNANHQIGGDGGKTIWTYYRAMSETSPARSRADLMNGTWDSRRDEILADLEKAHPGVADHVARLDVMRFGHAMIRPTPGLVSGDERQQIEDYGGRVQFGASDLSGISIFEEAQYRGVRAAERCLARLGYTGLEYA